MEHDDYAHLDGRIARWWAQDGAWHVTEIYVPTAQDREYYPQSYPAGDDGPFFRWADASFATRDQAIRDLTQE